MTQEVFPEIHAATAALEKRISLTEAEVVQMQEAVDRKEAAYQGMEESHCRSMPSEKKQSATT